MKTSLRAWHKTWFYCKNHEPRLPPLVGCLPKFQGSWHEEPAALELPQVTALTKKNQYFEGVWPDRSLCGRPLASPRCHPFEETGSPEVGIQRATRSDSGNHVKDPPRSSREASRRDVSKY
jgi:hypothetical protein